MIDVWYSAAFSLAKPSTPHKRHNASNPLLCERQSTDASRQENLAVTQNEILTDGTCHTFIAFSVGFHFAFYKSSSEVSVNLADGRQRYTYSRNTPATAPTRPSFEVFQNALKARRHRWCVGTLSLSLHYTVKNQSCEKGRERGKTHDTLVVRHSCTTCCL